MDEDENQLLAAAATPEELAALRPRSLQLALDAAEDPQLTADLVGSGHVPLRQVTLPATNMPPPTASRRRGQKQAVSGIDRCRSAHQGRAAPSPDTGRAGPSRDTNASC